MGSAPPPAPAHQKGHRTHIVIVQIVAHPLEAVAGFGQQRRDGQTGGRYRSNPAAALLRQQIVSMQAVDEIADLPGAQGI